MTPQTPQLPTLPEPEYKQAVRAGFIPGGEYVEQRPAFSAEQMREYARAALEAQKAEPAQPWFNLLAESRNVAYDEEGYIMQPDLASAVEDVDALLESQPQAQKAAAPELVGLNHIAIQDAWNALNPQDSSKDYFIAGVRWAERINGITPPTGSDK